MRILPASVTPSIKRQPQPALTFGATKWIWKAEDSFRRFENSLVADPWVAPGVPASVISYDDTSRAIRNAEAEQRIWETRENQESLKHLKRLSKTGTTAGEAEQPSIEPSAAFQRATLKASQKATYLNSLYGHQETLRAQKEKDLAETLARRSKTREANYESAAVLTRHQDQLGHTERSKRRQTDFLTWKQKEELASIERLEEYKLQKDRALLQLQIKIREANEIKKLAIRFENQTLYEQAIGEIEALKNEAQEQQALKEEADKIATAKKDLLALQLMLNAPPEGEVKDADDQRSPSGSGSKRPQASTSTHPFRLPVREPDRTPQNNFGQEPEDAEYAALLDRIRRLNTFDGPPGTR